MASLKLLRVEVHNCERFKLSNFQTLEVETSEDIQIVLGSNGSGKTTFTRFCCSPLPPPKDAFLEDGYLKRTFLFNGREYQLNFYNGKQTKHEFIDDTGVNLNKGMTETVQAVLVKDIFGIDAELFNLFTMSNGERFHLMSPMRRREWLTRLAHTDFDYALAVHEKANAALRDAKGALKHQVATLAKEQTTAVDEASQIELKARIAKLKTEVDDLYNRRDPNFDQNRVGQSLAALTQSFRSVAENISSVKKRKIAPVYTPGFNSKDDIADRLEQRKAELSRLEGSLDSQSERFQILKEKKAQLQKISRISIVTLERRIKKLKRFIKNIEDIWALNFSTEFVLSLNFSQLGEVLTAYSNQIRLMTPENWALFQDRKSVV